jgi:hypothetical protein
MNVTILIDRFGKSINQSMMYLDGTANTRLTAAAVLTQAVGVVPQRVMPKQELCLENLN